MTVTVGLPANEFVVPLVPSFTVKAAVPLMVSSTVMFDAATADRFLSVIVYVRSLFTGTEPLGDTVLLSASVGGVDVVGGVGAGQFTQNVLCLCGSWLNCSLKWKPCLLCTASPLATAFLINCCTSMTSITCFPPVLWS